ncbi:MAG: hypothetical protein COV72_05840 [Candidatus Omnitrophica bacterium CG11_big_fil_rev_8_21_14_0_20_42_13]|uniref:Mercuric reductase n=1 Tax=Candidatus Ghiorseimicrobium undicola TaxID=1974746 RepID=A0A2H0LWJ7_9BACT|nr:MAG: hypothetical protein COV72_05840 [Candidatus Omnitrophica bacterium CG11_big_fil_rev_8_21_14_0_20_42_13]
MRHENFDIIVIGGGAGGLFAVSVASALGAKACLIEKTRLGGDCTWFGCVPSKALLKSAHVANLINRFELFGLNLSKGIKLDTAGVMPHVRDIVHEVSTHHPNELFEKRGIKVVIGPVKFINQNTVEVNNQKFSAKKFIICTGSHPAIPPIEGLDKAGYLTNENIFDLDVLPKSLIVLGGGPIGIELSQALNRLGVKVHVVEMLERILFREDKEIASVLENSLKQEGVEILAGKKAVKVYKKDNLVTVIIESGDGRREEISAENILVAVGRAPNLEGLSLDKANVKHDKKGLIVNKYLQTTNKNIFACGDIAGPYQFSHVAAYQAGICVRNALFRRIAWQRVSYDNIVWATFTDPEVAHLGLIQEEAQKKYRGIKIYKSEYGVSDRAVTDSEKNGLIKIITDKKGYILGAHITGSSASEIMQGLLIAKSFNIKLSKIAEVLFIYPTLSEIVKKTAAKPLIAMADNPLIKFVLNIIKKR